MLYSTLIDPLSHNTLYTHDPFGHGPMLVTTDFYEAHGTFQAVAIAAATTTVISTPDEGGAIAINSMLLSAEKSNGNTVVVRFTDGVNTEVLFNQLLTNFDLNITLALPHGWRGWKNAGIEVVTSGTDTVNITLGYTKLNVGEEFSTWDAKR